LHRNEGQPPDRDGGDRRAADVAGGRAGGVRRAAKAGAWKVLGGGGFAVNAARNAVSGFHISGANCDLGKLRVLGQQKLRLATAGGVSNWIVGYNDPSRKNPNEISGVVPQRVKLKEGSKTLSGRLDLIFAVAGSPGDNAGNVVINGCDIPFNAKK
jgi:hypothetical protein